jgi:hypothetical protein
MTSQQLRGIRDANPFQPFIIHMTNGRKFRVPHRDFVSISPTGRTVMIYKDDAFSILDMLLVTEVGVEVSPLSQMAHLPVRDPRLAHNYGAS